MVFSSSALLSATAMAQEMPAGDVSRGQNFYQIACAVCHSPELGPNNTMIIKQGPSLVGVVGRKAASTKVFNYSKPLEDFGQTWDTETLYKFLANPVAMVPGTAMPIQITDSNTRADIVAYLATLKIPEGQLNDWNFNIYRKITNIVTAVSFT